MTSLSILFLGILGQWLNLCLTGGISGVKYTMFSDSTTWNAAYLYCTSGYNTELAEVNSPANDFLLSMFKTPDFTASVKGDFWIGLYDSAPSNKNQTTDGYTWSQSCQTLLLTNWSFWASGEPQHTGTELCVIVDRVTAVWKTAKCSDSRQFLCQTRLGSCDYFPVNRSCSLFNTTLDSSVSPASTHADCQQTCELAETAAVSRQCWGYSFNVTPDLCTLFYATKQGACPNVTVSNYYQRVCFTLSYNKTTLPPTTATGSSPNVSCGASTPVTTQLSTMHMTSGLPQETTSIALNITTVTGSTSSSIGSTDMSSTPENPQKTGTSNLSTQFTTDQSSFASETPSSPMTTAESTITDQMTTAANMNSIVTDTTISFSDVSSAVEDTTITAVAITSSTPSATTSEKFTTTTTTTLSTVTTFTTKTPTVDKRSIVRFCPCLCRDVKTAANVTLVMLQTEGLVKELTLNVTSLSSTRRKKDSVRDERPAAAGLGFAGVAVLFLAAGAILIPDVFVVIDGLMRRRGTKRSHSRR